MIYLMLEYHLAKFQLTSLISKIKCRFHENRINTNNNINKIAVKISGFALKRLAKYPYNKVNGNATSCVIKRIKINVV